MHKPGCTWEQDADFQLYQSDSNGPDFWLYMDKDGVVLNSTAESLKREIPFNFCPVCGVSLREDHPDPQERPSEDPSLWYHPEPENHPSEDPSLWHHPLNVAGLCWEDSYDGRQEFNFWTEDSEDFP